MKANARSDARLGSLLVGLQLVLMAWLALKAGVGLWGGTRPTDAFVVAVGGIAVGLWALSANRPGNFSIWPQPRAGGQFVTHGPYRWIRHPMYSALLLEGVAAARFAGDVETWLVLLALAIVLGVKATVEERGMIERHPAYREYRRRTHRFVPGLY